MSASEILVVDDEIDIRTLIEEILSEEGYRVQTAGDAGEARAQIAAQDPDLVLLDIWMPDTDGITLLKEWSDKEELHCPVVIMSGHGTVETAVEATRLGAVDYVEKPLSIAKLLRTVEKALEKGGEGLPVAEHHLAPLLLAPLGKSRAITALRQRAVEIAPHVQPVLILGENGTGREALARYIHAHSGRADEPFIHLVPATLNADNMTELLLGADTATGVEPGYLEQAAGGTLFINDLTLMPQHAQRLLAGVMEQGSFARVGRAEQMPVDIRFIVSAVPGADGNAQIPGILPELMSHFTILTLAVPPLREYPEDISEILRHFVDQLVDAQGSKFRRFSVAAQNRLRNYPWPGNIRELSQLVERLLIADGTEEISLPEIERELSPPSTGAGGSSVKKDLLAMPLREAREHFERDYLTQQLSLCDGKVGRLAKRVGMERTHLYRKLRALGVEFRHIGEDS